MMVILYKNYFKTMAKVRYPGIRPHSRVGHPVRSSWECCPEQYRRWARKKFPRSRNYEAGKQVGSLIVHFFSIMNVYDGINEFNEASVVFNF